MKLSNPRLTATITDWPFGRHQTTLAVFTVEEKPGHGQRVSRCTRKANGNWAKAKYTTYSPKFLIADGDDGRTYLVSEESMMGAVFVWPGTMQGSESVFQSSQPDRYRDLVKLFSELRERQVTANNN